MFRRLIKEAMPYSLFRILREAQGFATNAGMREEVLKNKKLHNRFVGQRCFILGNGPSLRQETLSSLRGEIVFTCNNIGKSDLIEELNPYAHFIMDARMVRGKEMSTQSSSIVDSVRSLKRQNASPILFLNFRLRDFAFKSGLTEEFDTYFIFQSSYGYDIKYTPNLCRSIPALPTVVQAEILVALYMGFVEIYLLGCDCTGFLSLAAVLSNDSSSQLPYVYTTDKVDREIISHVISQSKVANELSSYADIFRNYELMGTYCKDHGVKLINLSSGGILNELPRARLEDIIPEAAKKKPIISARKLVVRYGCRPNS